MDTVGFYHVGIVSLSGGNKVCFPWKGLSFCGLMWGFFCCGSSAGARENHVDK